MKLIVNKNNDEINIKISTKDGTKDFDYVELINYLYNNNKLEDTQFDENVNDWEKNSINELINNINSIIKKDNLDDKNIDKEMQEFLELFESNN